MSAAPSNARDARAEWRPGCGIETLQARARTLAEVRAFFAERGVLEVDTPVLGRTTVTEPAIDSLHVDTAAGRLFLQTSPEYHMKRLLAAGAPSIVRIGPVFRADEQGRLHNPEFTMIEWYRRGHDLAALMTEVRALVDSVAGPGPCRHVTYQALFETHYGVDPLTAGRRTFVALAERHGLVAADALDTGAIEDWLFAGAVAALAQGRTFITEFPAAAAALARCRTNAGGQRVAERFELVIDGVELANGYRELTDPAELARRMDADRARRARDGRAQPAPDTRLLDAMRHGLPDCSGVALGFDRLLMAKLGAGSLADVMPFTAANC